MHSEEVLGPEREFQAGYSLASSLEDLPEGVDVRCSLMTGGTSEGVEVVEVASPGLSLDIVPTRGMGVWAGRSRGLRLGWDSPVRRPVHPAFVDLQADGGRGWLHGFGEFVTRCGISWNGVPGEDAWLDGNGVEHRNQLSLHGRIANLPAERVEIEYEDGPSPSLRVRGTTREAGMFGPNLSMETLYEVAVGGSRLMITDTVTNEGDLDAEAQLLYHLNFGSPILGEGASIRVAADAVAPFTAASLAGVADLSDCGAPEPGRAEEVFLLRPLSGAGGCAAMLESRDGAVGVLVRFDTATLPCFVIWKMLGGPRDGYVVGLEPSTNYPNIRTMERARGRVRRLRPGMSETYRCSIEVLHGEGAVAGARATLSQIQDGRPQLLRGYPDPDFTPER